MGDGFYDGLTAAPDHPGWQRWSVGPPESFNQYVLGPMLVRAEDERFARVRLTPRPHHTNVNDVLHGGLLLSFIDTAMFSAASVLSGRSQARGVTVDVQVQFLSPGRMQADLDAQIEITRETGRLLFMRGLLEQGDDKVASFTGLLRKLS
ncbi:PaaI family thioesterase [Croceicoccus sp. BE223]|uniref:PaaI family thioesterase n=1 Tax=Croceicoccus sp. BE223 TaxID=2817716 RepID=UPI0028572C46|nr:PaaI family thioesterase [Croceicoccus sp. BE223]MDR7103398.1 uncharacterized protein (TIGR00369 family) [Croceicoccus sp. BE223]